MNLRERFGLRLPETVKKGRSLWIHAVSVGEVLSLQELIRRLKELHPDWAVYFSVLTNTGMRVARENLDGVDNFFFIPIDFPRIIRKFFRTLKPDLFILAESEFWPNLLKEAKKNTEGVLLINGRFSDRSCRMYTRFRRASLKVLSHIDKFLVQTEKEKECLLQIGLDEKRIKVSGNLKAEVKLPVFSSVELDNLKGSLNIKKGYKVLLCGSTRKGEEEQILRAFEAARSSRSDLLLILAPRHPQRTEEVAKICMDLNYHVIRRSELQAGEEWDILLLDTLGELSRLYSICDLAFIGGSLVPWGGHNLLEPAFYMKPICFGPHMHNFTFLSEAFIQAGAAQVVQNEEELEQLFKDAGEARLEKMGQKAKECLVSLQGATDRVIRMIEGLLVS